MWNVLLYFARHFWQTKAAEGSSPHIAVSVEHMMYQSSDASLFTVVDLQARVRLAQLLFGRLDGVPVE